MPILYDVNTISPTDFIYHATPDGNVFGRQSEDSQFYGLRFQDEENRLSAIDLSFGRTIADFQSGFYLGNEERGSRQWGARPLSRPVEPVLNIFRFSGPLPSNGIVLDVLNNDNDLLAWALAVSTFRQRSNDENVQWNALNSRYGRDFSSCSWILAPRSDDNMWEFIPDFLRGRMNIDGLRECVRELSAGYQLVIKKDDALSQLEFVEYDPYGIAPYRDEYSRMISEGRNYYWQYISKEPSFIVGDVQSTSPSVYDLSGVRQ